MIVARAAEQGHANAQSELGAMYANSEGVRKDLMLAHMWFDIAKANGQERARDWRDRFEAEMTRAQIARDTELARTCMASDYQNCGP